MGEKGDILIVGPVAAGDDEIFRQTVVSEIKRRGDDNPVGFLRIYSPGGDLGAALKIGEQVHLLQMNTWAPTASPRNSFKSKVSIPASDPRDCELPGERERWKRVSDAHGLYLNALIEAQRRGNYSSPKFEGQFATYDPLNRRGDARCQCASACFFIWAAGAIRSGNVVGVHRPSFDPARFSTLSPSEARTQYESLMRASKTYLAKVGISQELINRLFAIDSTKVSYLDQEELSGLHRSPHLEELLIAKCGRLTTKGELTAIIDNKYADRPKWNAEEHGSRAEDYIKTVGCEMDSTREVHRQTNAEYLRVYDKTDATTPSATAMPRDQIEAEARVLLKRILAASGIDEGYWVVPPKDAKELFEKAALAEPARVWWITTRNQDREIVGWLGILGPERAVGMEQAASWVAAGSSKSCIRDQCGRFIRGPLRSFKGGGRVTLACEHSDGKRDGGHYTFIERKEGGLYLLATLPTSENGLEAVGSVDDKIADAAIGLLVGSMGLKMRHESPAPPRRP